MRILLLLSVVGLLAGCAAEARYVPIPLEQRPTVLKAFGLKPESLDGLYGIGHNTVIVIAQGPAEGINWRASKASRSVTGTAQNWLDSAEISALHHCGLYKEENETCFVVYRGGWIGE